jgi:hypothetical protein
MITASRAKPNEVAERLTGRDYVSFSAISTYQSCPLRYFFLCGWPHKKNYVVSRVMWRSAVSHGKRSAGVAANAT